MFYIILLIPINLGHIRRISTINVEVEYNDKISLYFLLLVYLESLFMVKGGIVPILLFLY